MKRVELSLKEQTYYEIIKAVHEGHINKNRAVVALGCTPRHINRLLAQYQAKGKSAFIHGNNGRKPVHTFSATKKADILTLYTNKYPDANFTHACELLLTHDHIKISPSALRKLMLAEAILSPKASRTTRKTLKKRLEDQFKNATTKTEKKCLENQIIAVHHAHSRKPRAAYFGELLQMDASLHRWFGSQKTQLHIAIDDYSGSIVAAYFDTQETLKAYYTLLYQILTSHGIPYMFFTDNRTVFEYKRKKSPSKEEDTYTQFSYACKQLGIEIQTSSVPQAKGRVERAFQTLQSRLPVELRLAGITSTEQANAFLNSYIKKYNAKFALPVDYTKSVFEPQPSDEKINQMLAILAERTVDSGHCIRFENKYYKILDQHGSQVNFRRGTKGTVIKTFTGQLLFVAHDRVYALVEVPIHYVYSENFDLVPKENMKKHDIPDMNHPWRLGMFEKHQKRIINSQYYLEV